MKQIIVKKCRYCPYMGQRHGELYCKKIAEAHQNEMGLDDIYKDCPLTELPGRDEAMEILFKALPFSALSRLKSDDIKKIIDKLGFKEGV